MDVDNGMRAARVSDPERVSTGKIAHARVRGKPSPGKPLAALFFAGLGFDRRPEAAKSALKPVIGGLGGAAHDDSADHAGA